MAGAAGIPDDVKRFVDQCVTSVEGLELLLLVRRESGRSWTPEAAAATLHTSPTSSSIRFGELVAARVVSADDAGFRYSAPAGTDKVIGTLERFYGSHRARIIGMIFDKPPGPVRAFADAFRLRKDS